MNINEIHNINLFPLENIESYTLFLKNYILFTKINEEVVIALSKEYMSISLDYLSKISYSERIIFLDEIPLNDSGKVNKTLLKEKANAYIM